MAEVVAVEGDPALPPAFAAAAFVVGSYGVEDALIAHRRATSAIPAPARTAKSGPDAIAFNRNLGEQLGAILRARVSRGPAPGRALDGLEIALEGGQVGGPAYFSQVRDGGA